MLLFDISKHAINSHDNITPYIVSNVDNLEGVLFYVRKHVLCLFIGFQPTRIKVFMGFKRLICQFNVLFNGIDRSKNMRNLIP